MILAAQSKQTCAQTFKACSRCLMISIGLYETQVQDERTGLVFYTVESQIRYLNEVRAPATLGPRGAAARPPA